jgi:predicted nucleic acid-binding protein
MAYLIDTNVISEIRKGARCDANVARWIGAVDQSSLYLSVLVVGEIRRGIAKLAARDMAQSRALGDWLATILRAFQGRLLPVSTDVAITWGSMSAARTYPVIDALLAATARVHDLTLVTRNVADLDGSGAKLLNPFVPR